MSHPLLLGLFPNRTAAAAAAHEIHQLGVPRQDLSLVASDHPDGVAVEGKPKRSAGKQKKAVRAAGQLGELSGLIIGAIAVGMPGLGALVAAGPLAAELGEAAGRRAAGNLSKMLMKAGLSEEQADEWQQRIAEGGVLLGAHVRTADAAAVERVFVTHEPPRFVGTVWHDS